MIRALPAALLCLWTVGCELEPFTLDDDAGPDAVEAGPGAPDGATLRPDVDAPPEADGDFTDLGVDPDVDAEALDPDAEEPAPDAAAPAPDAAAPDAFVEYPPRYTDDRLVSPLTPRVAAHLRAIADRNDALQDDVFAKVGASSTVSRSFLHCFAGDNVNLSGRAPLRETIDFFKAGDAAGTNPYQRESVAAVVGWSALSALAGDPSPLDQEVAALRPRFAVIMYGTNDIQRRNLDQYAGNLLDMVELLTAQGIIPILSSVMPRDDDPAADLLVPSYNAVVRGVSQARMIPFIDLHQPLLGLPNHGLGNDRLHSSAYPGGACVFTEDGLLHGYNWRNLLTIETLDRLMRAVLDGDPAPDPPSATPLFDRAAPTRIPSLPYTDLRDTRADGRSVLASYPGCQAAQDESGPEVVYAFTVDAPVDVRAWVLDRGDVDVDLHLLRDPADPQSCVQRNDREIRATLTPGTWYFVLDSYVSGGQVKAGEYLFVVVAD